MQLNRLFTNKVFIHLNSHQLKPRKYTKYTLFSFCIAIVSLIGFDKHLYAAPNAATKCQLLLKCNDLSPTETTQDDARIIRVAYPTPQNSQYYGIGTLLKPGMGLTIHDTNNLSNALSAGFSWVRTDARWDNIEDTTKGVRNNFATIDYFASAAASNKVKMLWIVCCGNALYASTSNPGGYPIDQGTVSGFVGYVQALAHHLLQNYGPGQNYEVYNEPDSATFGNLTPTQYAALANAVIPAIKAIDPTAKVTTTGPGGWIDTPYEQAVFAAGFPAPGVKPDGIGLHTYIYPYEDTSPPHDDGDPELLFTPTYPAQESAPPYHPGYVNTWQAWEAIKTQYNINIPTWDTEGGTNLYNVINYASDPLAQARLMVRRTLVMWAAGFPVQMLYDKSDISATYDYCFLCNQNNITAFKTLSTLSAGHTLSGFTFDMALFGTSNLNFMKIDSPVDTIYIMWIRSGAYNLQGIPFGTTGYDMLGNTFKTNGQVPITATNGPIYLVVPK